MALLANTSTALAGSAFIQGSIEIASASGAITVPSNRGHHYVLITKAGSAAAMTLAAPTNPDDDGARLSIVATTAEAHTITATTIGFNAGNTGTDVATLGGAIGDGIGCIAYGGEWYVTDNINATLG